MPSTRNASEYVSNRSPANWRRGKALPAEIEPILKALFGNSEDHVAAREELRAAFIAARSEGNEAIVEQPASFVGQHSDISADCGAPAGAKLIIPLDADYVIALDDEELGTRCGEAALAFLGSQSVSIEIIFYVEALVMIEIEGIERVSEPTPANRKRLIELKSMSEWFDVYREQLARGLKLLLGEPKIHSGFLGITQFDRMAVAVRSFVYYHLRERLGGAISEDILVLSSFPGTGDSDMPIATIYLEGDDQAEFLTRHNLGGQPIPMMWPGYYFGDLGSELAIRRGLPAIVSALLFYAKRHELSDTDIHDGPIPWVWEWQLRLA